MNPQTLCAKCRHGSSAGFLSIPDTCKGVAPTLDLVTGRAMRPLCREKNDGKCEDFAPRLWARLALWWKGGAA